MHLDPYIFNNNNYRLLLIFAYAAVATWIAVPYVKNKCKAHGYMVKDMHKFKKPLIPVLGGVAIFIGIISALALSEIYIPTGNIANLFIFYFVVNLYGMYGLLDDIFHFQIRYTKVIALLVFSLPILTLTAGSTVLGINLGLMYAAFVVIYIMVVANLINLHAGFNGLGPGTTLILLIAAGVKSYMTSGSTYLMYLMPIVGSLLVFCIYNKYPAKIFDGNIGAFLTGSALGAFLIVAKLEVFGIIILIPHIITFILDTWVLTILKRKDIEFPNARKDGLIIIPKSMRYKSLKNVICTWFKLTEKEATHILWAITLVFCIIGVMFF
jgi:UDP-N-acetylglucosamine--dolichyl-phosphate N-acetylglucosaminephosphotransferase